MKRVVEDYEQHGYSLKGTKISMDCYYTSILLAKWLYDKNITCIGTLTSNWKGLPKEIRQTKGREENSWISCKNDKVKSLWIRMSWRLSLVARGMFVTANTKPVHYVTQDDRKMLLVTRYVTTLRVELTYPI